MDRNGKKELNLPNCNIFFEKNRGESVQLNAVPIIFPSRENSLSFLPKSERRIIRFLFRCIWGGPRSQSVRYPTKPQTIDRPIPSAQLPNFLFSALAVSISICHRLKQEEGNRKWAAAAQEERQLLFGAAQSGGRLGTRRRWGGPPARATAWFLGGGGREAEGEEIPFLPKEENSSGRVYNKKDAFVRMFSLQQCLYVFCEKNLYNKTFCFFDGAQYLSCKPAGHSFLSSSFLPVPAGEGEEEEEVYCKVELPFKYPPLSNRRGEKTGMVLREISQFVPGPDLLAFLLASH